MSSDSRTDQLADDEFSKIMQKCWPFVKDIMHALLPLVYTRTHGHSRTLGRSRRAAYLGILLFILFGAMLRHGASLSTQF